MNYQVDVVELPATVNAVALSNKDGGLALYVNAQCSREKQEEAVQDLLGRISAGELQRDRVVDVEIPGGSA